ncbi:MAG: HAD-IC family P-type ATPase, partial [Clostridia bacterium]|nr:HAD-IC family P-type ATPase [Clostridia bacterium]
MFTIPTRKNQQDTQRREVVHTRLREAAEAEISELYAAYNTTDQGLTEERVEELREEYGWNEITHGRSVSIPKRVFDAFINPFTVILMVLATVSLFTDVVYAEPGERNAMTVLIIAAMVLCSGLLRFVQETRSDNAAERLTKMIETTCCVERAESGKQEIVLEDVVVGDIVHLSAGDIVPADLRITRTKDLFLSQSALTGESEPIEKSAAGAGGFTGALTGYPNLAFMGTNIISGSAEGIVVAVGDDTFFGSMAKTLQAPPIKTSFEKGVNSVSWVLIRFMLIMVPVVLFINGFTKGDWTEAFLFAISIAVGLTPEMLPMIVTTCLAKGAVSMSKEKTIIKNLNSIQNLGSIDILCTDKTGTLTQDRVVLEYHLNIDGDEDVRVLRHGFLNSYYQTGLKNLMDYAIIERTGEEQDDEPTLQDLATHYTKVDEI